MDSVQRKQKNNFFYGWWIVLTGFLLMVFAYVAFLSTTSVFIIPVTEELGCARSGFVLYMTILSLTCVAVATPMGKIMAKKNMKLIMSASCIIAAIGFIGFSQATSLTHFYLLAVLLGFAFACLTTMPISILINNWFGGKIKGTAMGITFIGSGLGGMLMTPVLNAIISAYDWRIGYMVLAAVFIVILLPCILIFIVRTPEEKGLQKLGQTEAERNEKEVKGMTLSEAKNTPMLWLTLISVILVIFGSSAILANSVSFFIECGFSAAAAANIAGLMLGSLIIGKPLVGFFCDKLGIKSGAVISCWIFALGFLLLFFAPNVPSLAYAFLICYGFGGAAITVCPPLMVNGLFGEKDYGGIIGVITMATSIGGAFGGTIAAKVYDMTGSYTTFWMIAAGAMLLAGMMRGYCFILRKKYEF